MIEPCVMSRAALPFLNQSNLIEDAAFSIFMPFHDNNCPVLSENRPSLFRKQTILILENRSF